MEGTCRVGRIAGDERFERMPHLKVSKYRSTGPRYREVTQLLYLLTLYYRTRGALGHRLVWGERAAVQKRTPLERTVRHNARHSVFRPCVTPEPKIARAANQAIDAGEREFENELRERR